MTERLFDRDVGLAYLGIAALVFVALFFVSAGYGRHTRQGWGPVMNTRLAWMLMESPSLLIMSGCLRGNAYLNGHWLFALSPGEVIDARYRVGVALFEAGFVLSSRADRALAALRGPGDAGYRIPYGGLYQGISGPNYFGELLEWCGFALASCGRRPRLGDEGLAVYAARMRCVPSRAC